jgi:hypothetical protein
VSSRSAAIVLGVLVVAAAAVLVFGAARWRTRTRRLRRDLAVPAEGTAPRTYDPLETEELPAPVRRYFHAALGAGQPIVGSARIATEGEFLLDEKKNRWAPFTADQLFVARPPGFDWDARIRMAPGITIFVRDAYRAGAGLLRAEALGLVTVASQEPTPELAEGELLRWLAEACWLPTALLPSQGVRWEAIDGSRARATVTDRGTKASLEFRFSPDGLVSSVRAATRPRTVGAMNVPTPWEGRWADYGPRNGMRVPTSGEVAWVLPEGRLPYWRGRVTAAAYTFAGP